MLSKNLYKKFYTILNLKSIWKFTPPLVLVSYRKIRNLQRVLFAPISMNINAKKYMNLILESFPEFGSNSGSGRVLDIGANFGYFTKACVDLGYSVTAVEPHPYAIKNLYRFFRGNTKVKIDNKAVSNVTGIIDLYLHPQHLLDQKNTSIRASLVADKFSTKNRLSVPVSSTLLSSYFENQEHYSLVKIDIEGAEMYLVDDLIKFGARIDRLLLEKHSRFMMDSKLGEYYVVQMNKLDSYIAAHKWDKWSTNWI